MAEEVKLPSLGVAIQEAKVITVKKKIGDTVAKGEAIAEVETDKVTFEIVSPLDGVVLDICCQVGDMVALGRTMAVVGQPGEQAAVNSLRAADQGTQEGVKGAAATVEETDGERRLRVRATPSAKAAALKQGVDLATVTGTGPNGLITKEDVPKVADPSASAGDGPADEEVIPFAGVRKQIAERVQRSNSEYVQVTTVVEVDLTEIDTLRKILRKHIEEKEGISLTYLPFVVNAAVKALAEFPILNSSLQEEKIHVKKYVNFGVAVESGKGLIVPVVHAAEKMDFWTLVRRIDEVVQKAKAGSLGAEDLGSGTITISNAGSYGSLLSTPVIVYPQSSILWMGRVEDRPRYIGEEMKRRKMVYLCVTYDHRVMDGATVAKFLAKVKSILESPGSILVG